MGKGSSKILEKHSEIFMLIATAVFLAISIEILSDMITGQIPLIFAPIPIAVILLSLLWVCNFYLGELTIERIPVILLLDRETGTLLPSTYPPSFSATLALNKLKEKTKLSKIFTKKLPERNDPIIRDLIEWTILYWLSTLSQITMTSNGRVISSPLPCPERQVNNFEIHELLTGFGENVFSEVIKNMQPKLVLPHGVEIITRRYEPKGLEVGMKVGDKSIFRGILSGEPGGSETVIKGSFFSPLNIFVIRSVIERVSSGATMFLHLSGYTPLSISTREIICKERVIKGDELQALERWIEIDCSLLVGYKMRGYLFWHPKFTKWCDWAEGMRLRAKHYFDSTLYLKPAWR